MHLQQILQGFPLISTAADPARFTDRT